MESRREDLIPGEYVLNGFSDIGIDPDIRRYIGTSVTLIKKCKSGLYYIGTSDGKFFSVPKGNLETPEQYSERCSMNPVDLSGWTVEAAENLQTQHSLDLGKDLTAALIANICK